LSRKFIFLRATNLLCNGEIITIRDVLWQDLPDCYGEDHTQYRDAVYNYIRQHYGRVA
jgi:hypothetical protein